MSSNNLHSIPFIFINRRFQSNYPLNFENRLDRLHVKQFLQNCSKIVRKCLRNVDASDRLFRYTIVVYVAMMVCIGIFAIIAISLLSYLVNVIYPILVSIGVAIVPTIGFGFVVYQRGKKIKEYHSNCQISLENYIMAENQKTMRIGIQWFAKYEADSLNLLAPRLIPTRYLTKCPRIEVSDRELEFSFEMQTEEENEEIINEDEDDHIDDDNVRLINQDSNEY